MAVVVPVTFGDYGQADGGRGSRGRAVAAPVSMILHVVGAAAIVVVPLLTGDEIPEAHSGVRAFLAEPIVAPAPPPPPAARPAAAPRVTQKAPQQPAAFTAPVEVPSEIRPEEALDLGGLEGSPDGVEGGVPGGVVVGGIVGGLPDAPPPPLVPRRVGGDVREPRRLVAVAPVYPLLAQQARIEGVVIVEATVDERGRVVNATLLRGVPILSEAALEAVRQWVYTPTLLNGVPTPIIMTVTVRFKLGQPA